MISEMTEIFFSKRYKKLEITLKKRKYEFFNLIDKLKYSMYFTMRLKYLPPISPKIAANPYKICCLC